MQHRGVVLSHGLIFFCIASLLVLGAFVTPAGAQQTTDPLAGVDVTLRDTDDDDTPNVIVIPASDCRVEPDASVTVTNVDANGDPVGQPVELVNGQENIRIIPETTQLRIERAGGENIGGLDVGRGEVVRSRGVVCGGTAGNGDNGGGTGDNDDNAAENQYKADGKEVTVIIDTIPDKKVLVDTGGPSFATVGALLLGLGLVGLGVLVLRRT